MLKIKKLLFVALVVGMVFAVAGITQVPASAKTKINKKKVTISIDKKVKLKVKGTHKKVKWKSSNKKIVSVSKKGVIKGKSLGTTTVKAKVGKKTYKCKVTVKVDKNIKKKLINACVKKGEFELDDDGNIYYELKYLDYESGYYTVLDYYPATGNLWIGCVDLEFYDGIFINIKKIGAKKCEFRYGDLEYDELITGSLAKSKLKSVKGVSIALSNVGSYEGLKISRKIVWNFACIALYGFDDIMDKYNVKGVTAHKIGFVY